MEFNIKQLTNEQLDNLFHGVIYEINVRKAEKQNVDVGFWNSDGVYIPDIQKIDESDEWNELKEEKI